MSGYVFEIIARRFVPIGKQESCKITAGLQVQPIHAILQGKLLCQNLSSCHLKCFTKIDLINVHVF